MKYCLPKHPILVRISHHYQDIGYMYFIYRNTEIMRVHKIDNFSDNEQVRRNFPYVGINSYCHRALDSIFFLQIHDYFKNHETHGLVIINSR